MGILFTDDLKTNIISIDFQHQELFKVTNELLGACKEGKGSEAISSVINFLENYVKTHFQNEERYMLQYNYPGYNFHKIQHETFIKKTEELKDTFKKFGPTLSFTITVSSTIVNWLVNHIREMDRELANYLKKQNNFKE